MSTKELKKTSPNEAVEEIHALLEKCLIDGYLKKKGYTRESLKNLPEDVAKQLMKEASIYASGKLSEIEIKARLVKDIQDAGHLLE